MLKRISVQQLRPGMHLKQFCGSWLDHPFWRTGFVLTDPKDIAAILASPILEVWIDCSKGLDVEEGEAALSQAQTDAQVDAEVAEHQRQLRDLAPTSAVNEYARAAKIVNRAKQLVIDMFKEARLGHTLSEHDAHEVVSEITDSVRRNHSALISLARVKTADDYTYMHSVAVCAMMAALARQLGLDDTQVRNAGLAGLLHDIGKVEVPTEVLNKPGKLTPAEFELVKHHALAGHRLLLAGGTTNAVVLDVSLHHHEKMDGTGYPEGLRGEQISLFAKMGAVCDVYDAITSERPYKAGWDPAEALRHMAEWAEKGHFDSVVFQAFVKCMGIYPIGSLVRLNSGRVGVVIEQSGKSLTMPQVKVFYSSKAGMRILPEVVDLSAPAARERIVGREDLANWKAADIHALWQAAAQGM